MLSFLITSLAGEAAAVARVAGRGEEMYLVFKGSVWGICRQDYQVLSQHMALEIPL